MEKAFTIILLLILTGCSSSGPSYKNMSQFQARKALYSHFSKVQSLVALDRIKDFDLNFYNYLDHEHLIINTSTKESFLITLYLSCVDLDSAENITVHQTISGSLVIKKDAIGNIKYPKQKCMIQTIHQLSSQQVEQAKQLAMESQSRWPDI